MRKDKTMYLITFNIKFKDINPKIYRKMGLFWQLDFTRIVHHHFFLKLPVFFF